MQQSHALLAIAKLLVEFIRREKYMLRFETAASERPNFALFDTLCKT